jgi:alkaline phosphatase D
VLRSPAPQLWLHVTMDRQRNPAPHSSSGSSVFAHGVASGDPTPEGVVIWTRVSHPAPAVEVRWVIARDRFFNEVVAGGYTTAECERDWTVHVDVAALASGETYFFRFEAAGEVSPVGRTRTLPSGNVDHARFAFVSCAKFNAGFFNVYRRIAERDDLDFLLHLGDYIYEASNIPPATQTPGADIGRPFEPRHECQTLADYRMRYAQYRRDPDVQAMHAALPMIASLDDHELADGAWRDGADNHDEHRDGAWAVRRAAAFRARWEWLPARMPDPSDPERVFRAIRIGELAELFLLDFRSRRDQPTRGPDMASAERSALGAQQKGWFLDGFANSSTDWRLIGNPSPFARTWRPGLSGEMHRNMRALKFMHAKEDALDEDQWDGFPAERDELLRAIAASGAGRSVVLAGDLHASMAIEHEHPDDPTRAAVVEVVTPSVTSQNLDEKLRVDPGTVGPVIARSLEAELPGLRWCELESHGYVVTDVVPDAITLQWWFVDTVLERTSCEVLAQELVVPAGRSRVIDTAVGAAS